MPKRKNFPLLEQIISDMTPEVPPPPPKKLKITEFYSDSEIELTDEELPGPIRRKPETIKRNKTKKKVTRIQKRIKKEDMLKPTKITRMYLREMNNKLKKCFYEVFDAEGLPKPNINTPENIARRKEITQLCKYGELQEMSLNDIKNEDIAVAKFKETLKNKE